MKTMKEYANFGADIVFLFFVFIFVLLLLL